MFEYTFQWRVVWKHWPELIEAGLLTLQITVLFNRDWTGDCCSSCSNPGFQEPDREGCCDQLGCACTKHTRSLADLHGLFRSRCFWNTSISLYCCTWRDSFQQCGISHRDSSGRVSVHPGIAEFGCARTRTDEDTGIFVRCTSAGSADSVSSDCQSDHLGDARYVARNGDRAAGVDWNDYIPAIADISTVRILFCCSLSVSGCCKACNRAGTDCR